MKIAIATKNKNKVKELGALLNLDGVEFVSMTELGFDGEIEENGNTFEENALIKAKFICDKYSIPAIADDSGLCVDKLGGKPGIFSARYASLDGNNSDDKDNIIKLLSELEDIGENDRAAQFVCSMAFCHPDGTQIVKTGICHGHITNKCIGENGFGYDPVFYSNELSKTFGEATDAEKNTISHRAKAVRLMSDRLKEYIKQSK